MADTIKTSFSFSIGADNNIHSSAEIDSRTLEEGGDNAKRLGKTSGFMPGDIVAFLVYLSTDIEI
jgi:hypothetical protein